MERPVPRITIDDEPHWAGAARGELVMRRCTDCERWLPPDAGACWGCGSTALEWRAASGTATLHTFNVYHRAYHPWFAERIPYNTAVVELAEGPLMLSQVVNCALEDLAIGMPLTVVFEDIGDGRSLPKWQPARHSEA